MSTHPGASAEFSLTIPGRSVHNCTQSCLRSRRTQASKRYGFCNVAEHGGPDPGQLFGGWYWEADSGSALEVCRERRWSYI